MSTDQTQPVTPDPAPTPPARSGGVGMAALVWIGVAVVALSFVASFLGASLARSMDAADQAVAPVASPSSSMDYVAAIKEILPAGSAVRAGTGVPQAGKGYEGDVYIDIATSDVYVFRNGQWVLAGNIRTSAAENLTGETGPAGAAGAPGASGAAGADGTSGTPLTLGIGAPAAQKCQTPGEIYVDTSSLQFYECTSGTWVLFGPTPAPTSSPTPAVTP